MKICKVENCEYPVFSKGICNIHWKRQFGRPISKSSAKRQKQIVEYTINRKKFIHEERIKGGGRIYCRFCGAKIPGEPALHHTMGRDDETLLETKYWHLAHPLCHSDYHNRSFKYILWWSHYTRWVANNMPLCVHELLMNRMSKL